MSIISPLGISLTTLWQKMVAGASAIQRLPHTAHYSAPFPFGGMATDFSGSIQDFGDLDSSRQKSIRKGLKLMCREIQMGVAAAQLALQDANVVPGQFDPDQTGVVFGCDHIVAHPEEFVAAYEACRATGERFSLQAWGEKGLSQITPLWLLKYLPNMPASHITIYNDLRGPNNSITHREVSSGLAIAEGAATIKRGSAERMLVGATGSSLAPLRSLQSSFLGEMVLDGDNPTSACRPFDIDRRGVVFGEGAAALVLEDLATAEARGATIYAEILACGTSTAAHSNGAADIETSVFHAMRLALERAHMTATQIGHIHAHGLANRAGDLQEARAIQQLTQGSDSPTPVVASKGMMGNLGAAGGLVELVASILAIQNEFLFATVNCDQRDPECHINVIRDAGSKPGSNVLKVSYSPYGQAAAVLAAKI
jgi:3-oxoacyl-[acyl-carrier-protein] synthase II